MRWLWFVLAGVALIAALFAGARFLHNEYLLYASYIVLQYVVLATGWNILGGYAGYVNFGAAAFFAIGAYTSVVLHKTTSLPVPVMVLIGGAVAGLVGYGMGYLTLRLRGAFFAIGTLALAVVAQTIVTNWDYVGGSRGIYVVRPANLTLGSLQLSYIEYLFVIMGLVALGATALARAIERSRLGYGFATIRDDEQAAEACGVPTMKLKLLATTLSGALMGMAGAPLPYFVGYLQPTSAFGLDIAINAIAMPMIGGTVNWVGPVIGAILLGTLQQVATVTISSVVNLLLVGLLLMAFVVIAPDGILGLFRRPAGAARRRTFRSFLPRSAQ